MSLFSSKCASWLWSLMLLFALLGGCASQQPLSNYARTGDTVTVALGGSEESNALVEILKKEDISVTLTDSVGTMHPVSLRNLFRAYGDYTSGYMHRTHKSNVGPWYDSFVTPVYMGEWMAVVDLVDPVSGDAPALAEGTATLAFSSPAQLEQQHIYYWWDWTNGDLASVPIEILAGTGAANPLNYQQPVSFSPVTALEPLTQIAVEPSGTPSGMIGGGIFAFIYNPDDFGAPLKAVPAGHDPYVQLSSLNTDLGDGTRMLKVIVMNPNGFITTNNLRGATSFNPTSSESPFKSLRFSLVWDGVTEATNVTDANWQNAILLDASQSGYVDINGDPMPELTPSMAKVY